MISKLLNAKRYLPFTPFRTLRRNQSTSTPPKTYDEALALYKKQREELLKREQEVFKMHRFMVERNEMLPDSVKSELNRQLRDIKHRVDVALGRPSRNRIL